MSRLEFATTPLSSFGAQVHTDLSKPLDEAEQAALRALTFAMEF